MYQINKSTKTHSINILDANDIKNIEKIGEIGFGGGGKVFKVYMKNIYALKEMNVSNATIDDLKHFIGEYEIMNILNHPNILKTYGIFMSDNELPPSILTEFCEMNLDYAIKSKILSNVQIVCSVYQIAEGMKYVHSQKVIHRDLKPSNILIAKDGTIKIADFGISKLMTIEEQSNTRGVGTQKFMAPEIIDENEYDEKVDIYSFGVLIFFILSGGELPKIKVSEILKGQKAEIPQYFSPFAKQLIYSCWNFHPKDRPSFTAICEELEKNKYDLLHLTNNEVKSVQKFIKDHKSRIPPYD